MPETCALDVADRGPATLDEIGDAMNLTRERVRQIEIDALGRVRKRLVAAGLFEVEIAEWLSERLSSGRDGPVYPSPADGARELWAAMTAFEQRQMSGRTGTIAAAVNAKPLTIGQIRRRAGIHASTSEARYIVEHLVTAGVLERVGTSRYRRSIETTTEEVEARVPIA